MDCRGAGDAACRWPNRLRRAADDRAEQPAGALLFVHNYEIGTTPVATDFVYYGTRQIRLVKDGYETLVINQPIPAPWYEYFPADFVAENLVPGHIRDVRHADLQHAADDSSAAGSTDGTGRSVASQRESHAGFGAIDARTGVATARLAAGRTAAPGYFTAAE